MVYRIKKTNDYTTMSNYHFRDKTMSLKAKGLLSLMLSLPDDWDFSENGLTLLNADGKDSVKSALNELIKFGYVVRSQTRGNSGKFVKVDYDVYESPRLDKPITENPSTDKPITENPQQLNTNILNTKILNTKELKENYIKEFEKFWKAYPKKQDKQKALKWFEKNNPSEELMDIMLEKLKLFNRTKQWKKNDGQFIPMPTTWLNNKRWEDEIPKSDLVEEDEFENETEEEHMERLKRELREEGFNV